MDMKSDLTPCKKILYIDKIQGKLNVLSILLLFVSIVCVIFYTKNVYLWTGTSILSILIQLINRFKKKFFLSDQDVFATKQ